MANLKAPKSQHDLAPVYTWGFKSSRNPLVGGAVFSYAVRLNQDGTLSCNCPGWVIKRKDKPRRCKHTDTVLGEVPELMQAWKEGKTFTVEEESPGPAQAVVPVNITSTKREKPKPSSNSKIRFNRVLEI